jgi:hypothetical protein
MQRIYARICTRAFRGLAAPCSMRLTVRTKKDGGIGADPERQREDGYQH